MSVVANALARFRPNTAARLAGPIGIDIALHSIHLVQLESTAGGQLHVRAKASVAFDGPRSDLLAQPHQFRSLIRRALDSDRFHGRKAVLAMPSGMFRTVSINYPSGGAEEKEAAVVLRVMKNRLEGELSDYVLDYMPVKNRSKNDERLALVAVSERKQVIDYLELARLSRLDVQALEIGPVAIARLVGVLSDEQDSPNILVVNSGRRASYLTLISGKDLLFDQEIPIGEDTLIRRVSETLDISDQRAGELIMRTGVYPNAGSAVVQSDDETGLIKTMSEILKPQFLTLVQELKRAFMYAAAETRGGSVSQVFLLGSIARWPGADGLLSSLAGAKVEKIPDPLAWFPAEDGTEGLHEKKTTSEVAVATGLALRGMRHG